MSATRQILITGISSELGGVLARKLAENSDVKILGSMRRKLRSKEKFPDNVRVIDGCDLSHPECCQALGDTVQEMFTGPFGFVHSVGDFWDHVPFGEFEASKAMTMFSSHVTTYYNVLQALVPLMRAAGGGSCVAFSCNSVRYNYPWMASFTAAKSAVESITRSMANEFSGDGLRFNALVLASVKTQQVRESKPHGDFAHFITPEDIAPVVKFLFSTEAYLVNGNAIALFQHSDEFYNKGYFQRIAK